MGSGWSGFFHGGRAAQWVGVAAGGRPPETLEAEVGCSPPRMEKRQETDRDGLELRLPGQPQSCHSPAVTPQAKC